MVKRVLMGILLVVLLLLPAFALATESEEGFESPTRDPGAPKYDEEHPEQLQPEQLVARAYVLMERKSGELITSRYPDMQLFPASTTKVMTALITLQLEDDLSQIIPVTANAMNLPEDASMVPFREGEEVTLEDAMYGMMLRSGNEAANAIAEYVGGDIGSFVQYMNDTAAMLGCTNTNFTNPHGYHDPLHQTTARDLATMFRAALDNETFRQIIGTRTWDLKPTEKNPARKIYNSNLHLDSDPENYYYYPSSKGGKTGFNTPAGYVLVEWAEKNGVELIAVAMYTGKYSRWMDTKWLFEYGFTQYKSVTPEQIYASNPLTLQISGFDTSDTGLGRLELAIEPVDSTRSVRYTGLEEQVNAVMENYSGYTNEKWLIDFRAPIYQGQVVGTLTFFLENEIEPVEYELIATRSIPVRVDAPPTLEEIEAWVAADPSPFPPFSWDWVLPPVLGAGMVVYSVQAVFRRVFRRRRKSKQIPKPKKRTFN